MWSTVTIAECSKSCGNHPASNITLKIFIWGVTYLLKNESYKYKTNRREWPAAVTHHLQSNSQKRNRQSMLFKNKTWTFRQKELKICSGEGKNLWSFYQNHFCPFSNTCHFPFKAIQGGDPYASSVTFYGDDLFVAFSSKISKYSLCKCVFENTFVFIIVNVVWGARQFVCSITAQLPCSYAALHTRHFHRWACNKMKYCIPLGTGVFV